MKRAAEETLSCPPLPLAAKFRDQTQQNLTFSYCAELFDTNFTASSN